MRASAPLSLLALAAGLVAPPARANPLDTFGFGSRGAAMGGALAADVADESANYYNPAGLARAKGLGIGLGYFRADHALSMNGADNGVDPVKGLSGGLVAPGKVLGVPFAFGLGVHLPDDRVSRVRALRQEQPRWELYDNRNQRLWLAANVALSPWEWLQIGGGLSFMSSTRGRLDIGGYANLFRTEASQLRHEVDADLTAIRYPQAGARVKVGERLAFGLVYRGEFSLRLDLQATVQGDLSRLTQALYVLSTSSVNAFLPQQAVLGASARPLDALTVNLDLTWMNWSAYVPPVASVDVTIDIPPPSGGWPLGITPPTPPGRLVVVPISMKDTLVPHLGVEWHPVRSDAWELAARGGYEYARSPIPPQSGLTNYVDRDRHMVSVGAGVVLKRPLDGALREARLDAHGQLHVLPGALTRKDDPADFVGDYVAGGHVVSIGATLGAGF